RAHKERADETEREGQDRKKDRPAHQRPAPLERKRGMQKRRADEPRHQRRVLDRVPEPPTAPTERVVRPDATRGDSDREEYPRRENPRPHPARPAGVYAPFDQSGDRKRKRDRKTDIAQIQNWRMEDEAGILEQRIEFGAVRRRWIKTQEGIGGEKRKAKERSGDQSLNRQNVRLKRLAQTCPEQRERRAVDRKDQHPEEH